MIADVDEHKDVKNARLYRDKVKKSYDEAKADVEKRQRAFDKLKDDLANDFDPSITLPNFKTRVNNLEGAKIQLEVCERALEKAEADLQAARDKAKKNLQTRALAEYSHLLNKLAEKMPELVQINESVHAAWNRCNQLGVKTEPLFWKELLSQESSRNSKYVFWSGKIRQRRIEQLQKHPKNQKEDNELVA